MEIKVAFLELDLGHRRADALLNKGGSKGNSVDNYTCFRTQPQAVLQARWFPRH